MQGRKPTFSVVLPRDIKPVIHTMLTSHLCYILEGQYIEIKIQALQFYFF